MNNALHNAKVALAETHCITFTADRLKSALAALVDEVESASRQAARVDDMDAAAYRLGDYLVREQSVYLLHKSLRAALEAALSAKPANDPTDPGHDVEVLREQVRHLERRIRELHAQLAERKCDGQFCEHCDPEHGCKPAERQGDGFAVELEREVNHLLGFFADPPPSWVSRHIAWMREHYPAAPVGVPDGMVLVRKASLSYWQRELNGARQGDNAQQRAEIVHSGIAAYLAAAPVGAPVGIEAAIAHIQAKADAYAEEHCGVEWDTGATTYHYGQAGEDYHHGLLELVDELQALAAAPSARADRREAFEKVARARDYNLHHDSGGYEDELTQDAWQIWQAALAYALADGSFHPASVDAKAIQRVIDELDGYCDASEGSCYGTLSTDLVRGYTKQLAGAIQGKGDDGWKLVPLELTPEMAAAASAAVWPVASAEDREKARAAALIVLKSTMDLVPGATLDSLAAGIATMFPAYRAFLAAAPSAPQGVE